MAQASNRPDWARAQAIMAEGAARSTDAVVAAEFGAMAETLAG